MRSMYDNDYKGRGNYLVIDSFIPPVSMSIKIITENRKARHDYSIIETFEAGIVLRGTEVKSLREGKVNLKDSFAMVEDEEVFLHNCHISPYIHGNIYNHNPLRIRKLLLHKNEIAKVELALAKGKKLYDKREDIKKKTAMREIEKAFKESKR